MKIDRPTLILGGRHSDARGSIRFVNDFDMSRVKRFYIIENRDTFIKRGWRGHKIEQRWFNVIEGEFSVDLVKIDDWLNPSNTLPIERFRLTEADNVVLNIPAGYASCLTANISSSKLVVFADYHISHAAADDYLYPEDYFLSK